MADRRKLVFMVTHGPENAEMATIPFSLANAALASDMDVLMGFQSNGALLVKRGVAEGVSAPGFPPLKDLLDAYREGGGRMYACSPCCASRQITHADLVEGAAIAGGAAFVAEFTEAANVMVY